MKAYSPNSRRRWSDNDFNLGPLTFAWEGKYSRTGIMLCSGDDEYRGACLRFHAWALTILLALPSWLVPPQRRKVYPDRKHWPQETIDRLGRDWYYDISQREFGFTIYGGREEGGAMHVHYGRQTMDSQTQKSWCYFFPWSQWRHVRHSLYGLRGERFADMPQQARGLHLGDPGFNDHWDQGRALEAACPAAVFAFKDYDGEELTVTTRIEEREWLLGEKWCKWLSWFAKPKVRRSLDLRFSDETGRRKGSWKGGTLGHGINILPGELHEAAFRRYCAEHEMTFLAAHP